MKFEEFKKYKKIVESNSANLEVFPEAKSVYTWMEESGRIDEGMWSSIWSWIKRNFSWKARRIHALADKYEKELAEEMKAEYGKIKDHNDLKSRFRRSFAGKVAEEIHEKMLIIAGDDDDYRDLVRHLINKKNLKVKTSLLGEFSGVLDDSDESELRSEFSRQERETQANYEKTLRNMMSERDTKTIFSSVQQKAKSDKIYEQIGIKTNVQIEEFIKLILYYVSTRAEKESSFEFNKKNAEKAMKEYADIVMELARKLESKCDDREECMKLIRESLDHLIKSEKPQEMGRFKYNVYSTVEKHLNRKKSSSDAAEKAEDEATTSYTSMELDDDEVETAVDDAAEETGKDDPDASDILKEIETTVDNYFSKQTNVDYLVDRLNDKIEAFNNFSDGERERLKDKYNYDLEDNKFKPVNDEVARKLTRNFKQICGAIVPYYQLDHDKSVNVLKTALRYMFEIYAANKDYTGSLKDSDVDTILDNIKTKYPKIYK